MYVAICCVYNCLLLAQNPNFHFSKFCLPFSDCMRLDSCFQLLHGLFLFLWLVSLRPKLVLSLYVDSVALPVASRDSYALVLPSQPLSKRPLERAGDSL